MTIGCNTRGPGEGVSYWGLIPGSHGQTVRVGRSATRSPTRLRGSLPVNSPCDVVIVEYSIDRRIIILLLAHGDLVV